MMPLDVVPELTVIKSQVLSELRISKGSEAATPPWGYDRIDRDQLRVGSFA
jgi:hypothetical protein